MIVISHPKQTYKDSKKKTFRCPFHSSRVHHRISYLGSVAVQQVLAEIGLTNSLKTRKNDCPIPSAKMLKWSIWCIWSHVCLEDPVPIQNNRTVIMLTLLKSRPSGCCNHHARSFLQQDSLAMWLVNMEAGWWLGHPSEKYDFVNWDDDIPNINGKI